MISNKKNIIYLILGQFISVFGGALLRFSLSLFVLDITGRADIFATILAISNLPILLAPIGGVIADRINLKRVMVLMDVANAIIGLLLLFIVLTSESIFGIGIMVFVLGIPGSFDTPVVSASIPLLVEADELEEVNGLSQGILHLSTVVAPILGGVFYGLLGVKVLVASSVLFFLIAAFTESFLIIPSGRQEKVKGGILQILVIDIKEVVKEVTEQKTIFKSIVIATATNFILTSFLIVGLPVMFRVTLQSSDFLYGVGMSIFSLSSIIGSIFARRLTKKLSFDKLYNVFLYSGILIMIANLVINLTNKRIGYFALIIMEFIIGAILSAISIYLITKIQRITAKRNLGKVMALVVAIANSVVPLGQLLMGLIFRNTDNGVFLNILIVTILVFALSIVCFFMFKKSDTHISE